MTTIHAPDLFSAKGPDGIRVRGRVTTQYREILTPGALAFVAGLARRFESRRQDILRARVIRQSEIDHGALPAPPPETDWIRESEWTVAPVPPGLMDRRVEVCGAVDRQSMVTALTCGASSYLADLEDGTSPTWDNTLRAQLNLRDAADGTIGYEGADGAYHRVTEPGATLVVRPRGWHLDERRLAVDGRPVAAALVDAGLFLFHSARPLIARGAGPYFCLPKLETYFEARLWNDVLDFAERELGLASGAVRVTVQIENVLAAYQMDELLFELRDRAAALRFGWWDYVASLALKFRNHPELMLPGRRHLTPSAPYLRAVLDVMVHTCHRRGVHAIGPTVALAPDRAQDDAVLEDVVQQILDAVSGGLDGVQMVDPRLVSMAQGVFDAQLKGPHQLHRQPDAPVTAGEAFLPNNTEIPTEEELRDQVRLTVKYLAGWLSARGYVRFQRHLENLSAAEAARSLVWCWAKHAVTLDTGRRVRPHWIRQLVDEELRRMIDEDGPAVVAADRYDLASKIAIELMATTTCPPSIAAAAGQYLN